MGMAAETWVGAGCGATMVCWQVGHGPLTPAISAGTRSAV